MKSSFSRKVYNSTASVVELKHLLESAKRRIVELALENTG